MCLVRVGVHEGVVGLVVVGSREEEREHRQRQREGEAKTAGH